MYLLYIVKSFNYIEIFFLLSIIFHLILQVHFIGISKSNKKNTLCKKEEKLYLYFVVIMENEN